MNTTSGFPETCTPANSGNAATSTTPPPVSSSSSKNQRRERINPWMLFVSALVPNWLLRRSEVSQGAKLCYARLAQYAGRDGQCFPKQSTLADELGVGERMVRGYLGELTKFGLIESEQHGLGTSNSYYFLDHAWIHEGEPANGDSGLERKPAAAPDRRETTGPDRKNSSVPYIDKRILEGNQVKIDINTLSTQKLPFDEQEAVNQAVIAGVPTEFARTEYLRLESTGWLNGAGNAVRNWPAHIRKRWSDDQNQRAERRNSGRTTSKRPPGPPRHFNQSDYNQPSKDF
jgi:hypothetical protein